MSFLLKKNKFFLKLSRIIIALIILMLFSFGFSSYEGNQFFYILFALTNIYLIYFSFRKKATFFETFFGTLLFLGFGFKFSAVISFTDGMFREGVGNFDYSSKSFDYSLLVSSIGIITFIVFGHIREFFFVYPKKIKSINFNPNLYISNRTKIISAFILLVFIICFLNIYFAIYQKGLIPTQEYNFFFSGFIKWSLLYGLTCLAALMIFFEINSFKKVFNLTVIIGIIETLSITYSIPIGGAQFPRAYEIVE